jgi:DNA repair protein RadC
LSYITQYQVILKKVSTFPANVFVRCPEDAAKAAENFLRITYSGEMPDRELFGVLYLNVKNEVVGLEVISIGSLNAAIVHPRETFKGAIIYGAASIIGFHNHPSGNPTPSPEDIQLTNRLVSVGELIGIDFCDHVVLGDGNYYSFREHNHF